MSKIIEINVGGNVYSTTKTTLLSEPESILALLEQNELILRDERNRPFFVLISELCITVFHISNFNVPPFKGSNLVSFRENFKGYLK